jgi:hypothetical protein
MKSWINFSWQDWCRLKPIAATLKQIRNDCVLYFYKKTKANDEDVFLQDMRIYHNQNILIVIAFEQVKVLDWLLSLSKKNLIDFQLMVFDNSKNTQSRELIRALCRTHDIPYLALPYNYTAHPNRSHGLAMTWVFDRIIQKIQPSWFGFLDHDMLPVRPVSLGHLIGRQSYYGLLNEGDNCWNLWAGYCFFEYPMVAHLPLNFLYDFSRGLDTGGRNWSVLYSRLSRPAVHFADETKKTLRLRDQSAIMAQVIDHAWVHIGGVSYNNNLQPKELFYENLVRDLLEGRSHDILSDMAS